MEDEEFFKWENEAHRVYINALGYYPLEKEAYLRGVRECHKEYFSDFDAQKYEIEELKSKIENLEWENRDLEKRIGGIEND